MKATVIGRFVHYRTDGVYDLLGVLTDADTCDAVAVYRAVGGDHDGMVWCRPAAEFFGTVTLPPRLPIVHGEPALYLSPESPVVRRFRPVNLEYPQSAPHSESESEETA